MNESITERFELFQKSYNEAINTIKQYQENEEMKNITNWLLSNEYNAYGYLPACWAEAPYSAESMSSLLHYIHHALVDDGSICFPVIRNAPRIVFVDECDFDLKRDVNRFYHFYQDDDKITFLDNIDDFIRERNLFEINQFKKCFINDAAQFGLEYGKQYYSHYKCFNEDWVNDPQIKIKHKELVKAGFLNE